MLGLVRCNHFLTGVGRENTAGYRLCARRARLPGKAWLYTYLSEAYSLPMAAEFDASEFVDDDFQTARKSPGAGAVAESMSSTARLLMAPARNNRHCQRGRLIPKGYVPIVNVANSKWRFSSLRASNFVVLSEAKNPATSTYLELKLADNS